MNGEFHQGREFLGAGIAFPLNVNEDGLIAMNAQEDHVRQSILLILQTAKGERVMRPDFGARLSDLAFEPITQATITLAQHYVKEALIRFEPRIEVLKVEITRNPQEQDRESILRAVNRSSVRRRPAPGNSQEEDCLWIRLHYRVRSTDTTFNLVYPFYIERGGL
jgi:phage baseplate assembly protein W